MNVNEPETRGVALALHVVLDDLGKVLQLVLLFLINKEINIYLFLFIR